jgi:hypothetical protein
MDITRCSVTSAAQPVPMTRFQQTVATARRVVDGAEARTLARRRVRALVDRVDEAIAACERTHLDRRRDAPEELVACAEGVVAEVLALHAEGVDLLGGIRIDGRLPTRVVDLMDRLWLLQERMFDVLTPGRRDLLAGDEW